MCVQSALGLNIPSSETSREAEKYFFGVDHLKVASMEYWFVVTFAFITANEASQLYVGTFL